MVESWKNIPVTDVKVTDVRVAFFKVRDDRRTYVKVTDVII